MRIGVPLPEATMRSAISSPRCPGTSWSSTAASSIGVLRSERRGGLGGGLASTVWPARGQAAVQIGQSRVHAGPNQHAAAIASLAKMMTADLVLRDHPLRLGEDGPTI